VLSPGRTFLRGTRSDANANSVVLRVDHGEDCVYLAGDSEALTEARIVRAGLEPCEVLKVAHHGSAYNTSDLFLDALRPEIAIVSVGTRNRYGHPSPETLGRLGRRGVAVYRTDVSHTLRVLSSGRGVEVLEDIGPARPAPAPRTPATAEGATRLPPPLPIGSDPGYRCGMEVAP